MAGSSQPLGRQFPITNDDGTPTEYFIRWAQKRQLDISTDDSLSQLKDVDFNVPPTDGQVIVYDASSKTWRPADQSGGGGGGGGTSFPASPALNERFYRTDQDLEYFWNGTYWLTTTLYREALPSYRDQSNASANTVDNIQYLIAMHYSATTPNGIVVERFTSTIWRLSTATWQMRLVNGAGIVYANHTYDPSFSAATYHTQTTDLNLFFSQGQPLAYIPNTSAGGFFDTSLTYRIVG